MNERVDVLAVIRRHAELHRQQAEVDAYSAQEAPRLEAALSAVAELIEAAKYVVQSNPTFGTPGVDALNVALSRIQPDGQG